MISRKVRVGTFWRRGNTSISPVLAAAVLAVLLTAPGWTQEVSGWRLTTTLYGEDSGRFSQPQGIFYHEETGTLVVGSTGDNRLVLYGESDGVLTVKATITQPNIFTAPRYFVRDSKGNIIVSQEVSRKLQVINLQGVQVETIDFKEVPGGERLMPGPLAIRSDRLYVVDLTGVRIVVLDERRQFVRQMHPDDPAFRGFNALAVDGGGFVYGLDTLGGRIYKFSPDGTMESKFGQRGLEPDQFEFPTALAVDKRGLIYVVDQHRGTVLVFNRQGSYQGHFVSKGWEEGKVYYPSAIAVDRSGRVFIADRNNQRVVVFAPKEE